MKKKIVVIGLISAQILIASYLNAADYVQARTEVAEAIEKAIKDFSKKNIDKAQLALNRAKAMFDPTTNAIFKWDDYEKELQYMSAIKQIGSFATAEPQKLISSLDEIFGLWNTAPVDIRDLAYKEILVALDRITKKAQEWDEEPLDRLQKILRGIRSSHFSNMNPNFRAYFNKAQEAIDAGLAQHQAAAAAREVNAAIDAADANPAKIQEAEEVLAKAESKYGRGNWTSARERLTKIQIANLKPQDNYTRGSATSSTTTPAYVLPAPSAPPMNQMPSEEASSQLPPALPPRPETTTKFPSAAYGKAATMEEMQMRLGQLQDKLQMLKAAMPK